MSSARRRNLASAERPIFLGIQLCLSADDAAPPGLYGRSMRLVEKARPGAGLGPPPRTADRPAGPPRPGRRPRRERLPSA